ncbi:hypothetical protein, partial [Sphingomonas sp.]|uniref:hypothetical protein n=1 Tax=Sphingomonas sp. TaxID=28214 RepID=UPI00325FB015
MAKMIIEIPEEWKELGEALAATLARAQRTVAGAGGGKAIDYGRVESELSEQVAQVERCAHRGILQALDID